MNKEQLLKEWLEEEKAAHIHGWDFTHIYILGNMRRKMICLGIMAR